MANKTLGINLQFNADVSTAVTNLRNLQQSITSIAATPIPIGTKLSAEMQTAVQSAKQLQLHITNAFNTKTGNLDLSKLNTSLKASGQSLSTLSNNLLGAGMKGEQAFINIQRAISTANVQINTASTALGRFMTTMKNTAKWQLSSSLIHGFIGGIQSAIGYAKDLDKSLNSIRIVTGYSAEAMADFAKEANKAAKALNTTTTKYTDASLIYFQQGLDMNEVKERTETTIKLANVSRQSVEETSNQMTAIWNNFDNGTKSLEYYADVMTKLGAKTASSTKEIAGGLEKFAAVADTIGLSYEYAASALATITANTRQSEEVVGTALKTIFARIQGLKLGETLEDGVELNKYSEALAKIGVDILDVNDNLINADQILEKTAERWKTLSEAQKTATAQTVAGIRQYNQFIALMENWDDGTSDSMVTNLSTAFGAEGELQSQADRYAESWEAASAKLKASTENVWNNLIPTEGLVDFTNGLSEIVDVLASIVRGFGGFQSILLLIANIALTKLGPSISIGIDQGLNKIQEFGTKTISIFGELGPKIAHPIASFKQWQNSTDATNNSFTMMNNHLQGIISGTGNAKKQIDLYDNSLKSSNQSLNEAQLSISKAVNGGQNLTSTFKSYVADMAQVNNLQSLITKNSHLLTASTKEQLSGMQQQLLAISEKKAQEADTLELLELERNNLSEIQTVRMQNISVGTHGPAFMEMSNISNQIGMEWGNILARASEAGGEIRNINGSLQIQAKTTGEVRSTAIGMTQTYSQVRQITEEINQIYKDGTKLPRAQAKEARALINQKIKDKIITEEIGNKLKEQLGIQNNQAPATEKVRNALGGVRQELQTVMTGLGHSNRHILELNNNADRISTTTSRWKQYIEEYKNALSNVSTVMQNGLQGALSWGGALQGLAQGASRVAMGINQIVNFAKQLTSGDADFTTILVSGTMALSMGLSGLMTLLGGINTLITTQNALKTISNVLDEAKIANITEETAAETAKIIVQKLGIKTEGNEAFMDALTTALKEKKTGAIIKLIAAQLGLNAAMAPMLIILAGIVAAVLLVVGGLKLADAAYNADAKAAEKAGEAAQKAAKQFEEAQNKYNGFKDSISKYDEAVDGLAKLTKGTIEYKEQIAKANEEAMKLIDSQGLLYGTDYKYNQEGLIEFIPGKLEQAREEEFNNLQRMEANKSFTAQRAKTAQEKADLTEFARNNLNDDGWMQSEDWGDTAKAGGWALGGAALGAAIGTVIPVIGNAIGAAVGAAIGAGAGLIAGVIDVLTDEVEGDSSKNEIESMRKLAEAYDKQGEAALKPENVKEILGENNTILDDVFAKPTAEMTKALIEKKDSDAKFDMEELNDLFAEKGENITPEDLKAYFDQNSIEIDQASIDQMFQSIIDPEVKSQIASLAANTAAIRAHIERTAGSANQDNEAYQRLSEEDQSIADKIIANRVDDALADKDSEAYAQLEKDAVTAWQEEVDTDEKGFFKGDESLTYDKYMEITYGKDWKDNYKVENMGGTNATIYQMKDGKWENIDPDDKKNTLSNDEVKEALVEYYAKQYGDADAAKLAKVNTAAAEVRANVGGIGTIADQDIKSAFASGETADLTFMTEEQKDELKAELENGTIKVTDEYKQLLLDGANAWSQAAHDARMEAEADSVITEGASKYGLDEKVLKAQAEMLQQTHKGLENNAVAAAEMAVANQRLNKGVNKLTDNWKNWNKTLRSSDKTTQDYAEAVVGAQDAMRDMFGLTEDAVIPEDFLQDTENLDLLDQIANGSEEAAQKLHFNLTKAQIEAETFSSDIKQNMINAFEFGEDTDFEATFNEMKTQALNALSEIQGMANGVDIGAGLKDPAKQAEMAAKLNEYAMAAGWTAEQMQSALASVGVRAKITMVEGNPVTKKIPITRITRSFPKFTSMEGPDGKTHYGFSQDETSEVVGYKDVTEPTLVPQIDMEDPENPSGQIAPIFEKVDMGNIAPSATTGGKSSGGGGGGNGESKVVQKKAPIKAKKEKDEIERYHEISKAIEDQERVVDRLSKAKDKAYGANKLKAIDNEIAALQKLNKLDSQHLKQIREKLALDRKAAAEEHGITFDEFGRINNYEEIIKQKMEWWRTEQQKIQDRETEYEKEKNYNKEYDADGAIKLKIDQDKEKIDEQYEDFKEAITQYEETYSLSEDTVDKMQDQFDQMAEKAIEKITYEVEFKVEFEESAIDLLDFQIELLGEDFDAFAEIASITMEKTTHLSKALQAQSDGVGALYEAYDKGAISLDQFVENMKESLPDILSSMQNMISLDKEMMEYYSKAFDAAEEKFTEYLDFIDSGISKLDHFQNMLSLIGKEQNYDMLGVVLESQYTSASHRLQASSDWYETTKKEYDALYNRWIAEKNLLGPKELEMLEEKLKVARTKMQEADEQRLSDLEAVGEKAQEILQNNLNMARKKFEENLVGSSLEDYMNELDRLSKKQEEYLTNTNKMYETNKLIRQAQMEMDKTDNNRAKQQYNDYVKYIEQLQETGKLSSYELSVAQAKYELLQAQIALEEAKDAKDQVRLTRDSEGNYGYVYTANEDKVSGAEQAVADAENKLYNIGLEGAQDYQSKKAEILQEAIDTFASIEEQYQTGQIETEAEFNAKMEEAKQYYYDRLKEYDNLYYMALGVMQEESYGNTIDYELDSRNVFDTFATHVDGYLGDVEQSFTDYNNKVGVIKQEVGDDLEAMRKKTEEVTKETEKLTLEAEKLTDQIDNELLSAREATSIWGAYRDELYKNIEANKTLIEQLRTIQELQGGELADYSSFISDQVAKGKGYDDRLIQEALSKRWLKMEGVDNYDYTQKKIDYVQEYADLNGLTFEEAETALQDDAWYKTLGILRQYKIERTDWAAKKKEILEKDPKADVSWIDNIIAEKLSYDWAAKIQQYIERNPGLKYDDEYLQEMLTIRQIKIDSLKNPKDVISNDELLAPYIEKGKLIDDRKNVSSAVSAATGGYTGEWGPEGKIAILHEKELILNAQDTQNFLSAVEILREINGILDQNALVASLGAINMQALSLNSLADQVLQQEVTIHADFPNVTDHNEIELAIDNLINAASQHAYRT